MNNVNLNKSLIATYSVLVIITLAALMVVKEFNISYPLTISNNMSSNELTVTGEGKVEAVPDTATINAGITVTNAKTVEEAEKQINEVNNKIVAAMKGLGIPEKDIQTSNYSINPNYSFDPQQQVQGYNADASVTVKTHKLDQVSQIITKLTEAGANQVSGVQFSIDDMSAFRVKAREEAIKDAKDQAKNLADTLGIRLGKITNISESTGGIEPVPYMARSFAEGDVAMMDQSPEIEPGSQTVISTVTLFYERK